MPSLASSSGRACVCVCARVHVRVHIRVRVRVSLRARVRVHVHVPCSTCIVSAKAVHSQKPHVCSDVRLSLQMLIE